MMGGRIGASRGDLLRLFDGASAAGLDDGELLGRFVARRDEVAFESLVARLGPMVVGVCRRMLRDPHDVDDAFQATFLVLVRRAGSIRDREVVATWLYEVAVRVARRARLDAARRADRERRGAVAEAREAGGDAGADRSEVRAQIDEEIGRLPESHRRLVVLCDVEGLSREEAAARLGWTANMVRGRLERARGRLRDRLTRRGLAPSGAWLALATPGLPPRPALVAATVRCAMGRSTVAGLASASAVSLSEGVIRMMMLSKWKLAASALLSAGAVVAGSGMLAAQGPGGGPVPPVAVPVAPPAPFVPRTAVAGEAKFRPRSVADLGKARVDAAKARYDAQKAFYDDGRITIDRVIDASRSLRDTERDAAGTKIARAAAALFHHGRVAEMLAHEEVEFAAGRATAPDVNEIKSAVLDAEFALAKELEAPEPIAAEAPAAAKKGTDLRFARKAAGEGARDLLADVERLRLDAESLRLGEAPKAGEVIAMAPFRSRGGTSPTTRPGAEPSSLAGAIAAFNERWKDDPVGREQPPLTEDEVIAAIRVWLPDRETGAIAGGVRTNVTPADAPIDAFKAIAETRRMPVGATFGATKSRDVGDDQLYAGWWVALALAKAQPNPAGRVAPAREGSHPFSIRERLVRSVPLEEVLKDEEAGERRQSGLILSDQLPLPARVKNLKDRIEWRDRKIKR